MNFSRDVVDAAPAQGLALIELTRDGSRRTWTFADVSEASGRLAGQLAKLGLGKGDVVVIWLGNRAEWVLSMLACFRLGIIPAACPEQLRGKDLRLRIDAASPALLIADERNRDQLERVGLPCPVLWMPQDELWTTGPVAAAVELEPSDPCLVTFTSGTSGLPKPVLHLQRYLSGQRLQAEHWLGANAGDVVWCTAASGWSKSARNAFIAPWLRGAAAVLHDGRFDPDERLAIVAREEVRALCMAPTEYRIITKRSQVPQLPSLESSVAAGEALDPAAIAAWREATGCEVRDGYGQTETGQLTGFAPGEAVRSGSMGRALPGVRLWIDKGELVADPESVPTFFGGYLGELSVARKEPWRTGDRTEIDEDGYLWFQGRADDIIVSAGYRIGPFEVESVLATHPAVEESAVIAAPDEERGAVVRAVVVLRDGYAPSDQLGRELQDHVKSETAPYKYPRRVDFIESLPKTSSGKVRRAALRGNG